VPGADEIIALASRVPINVPSSACAGTAVNARTQPVSAPNAKTYWTFSAVANPSAAATEYTIQSNGSSRCRSRRPSPRTTTYFANSSIKATPRTAHANRRGTLALSAVDPSSGVSTSPSR
jgi:hypothetical protein